MRKSIVIFSVAKLEDMKKKGNISYIKHYEVYFDDVYMVYLIGNSKSYKDGNTHFISLGCNSCIRSLLFAPISLYKFIKNKKIDVFITGDLIFSWWNSILIKLFKNTKIFLMPVAMPHIIFESSGKTMTGILPQFVEKIFIKLSFANADKVIIPKYVKDYKMWLCSVVKKKKQLYLDVLVDELPSYDFYKELKYNTIENRNKKTLLYVGRLHKEKMVLDILKAFNILYKKDNEIKLWIIGDGNERELLQKYCKDNNLEENVVFFGSKRASELVGFYKKATIFVSPLTGTSLREAALCGLPIVCYKTDWVVNTFQSELLFVEKNNIDDFAKKIKFLLEHAKQRKELSKIMYGYAHSHWSIELLKEQLLKIYLIARQI